MRQREGTRDMDGFIEILKAVLFGVVQGITEWLPISSTGHMILLEELLPMQVSPAFWEMFLVVVQLGSILAVVVLYFHRLNPFSLKKTPPQRWETIQLWLRILVACIPAGVVGVLFNDQIHEIFFHYWVVAIALIVYGVLFLVLESRNRRRRPKIASLARLDYRTALFIGAFQMLSLIPGTSRSGSTILGALLIGVARPIAAEFSFFLAIPVMAGASALELVGGGFQYTALEWGILATGMIVAFLVSVFAIKFLVGFVRKHDFKPFGWYRIVLGIAVLCYFCFLYKPAA